MKKFLELFNWFYKKIRKINILSLHKNMMQRNKINYKMWTISLYTSRL